MATTPSPSAIRAYSKEYDMQAPAGKNVHERFAGGGTVGDRAKYDKLSRGDKMLDLQARQNERVSAENRLGSAQEARRRNVEERGQPPAIYDAEVTRRERMLQEARDKENYKDITRKFAAGGMVRRGYGKARGA